jgi:prephenate dehydratase
MDTALSAKEIAEKGLTGIAAISSGRAAEKYHLSVIAESIETHTKNYTRFLILKGKNGEIHETVTVNKASLTFALAHKIGGLSKVLSILSYYDINLAKFNPCPSSGKTGNISSSWMLKLIIINFIIRQLCYCHSQAVFRFLVVFKGKSIME